LVRVALEGEEICISVEDNGSGILESHIEKIFEPKFTTKTSGMGLGLGMVKNIVENSQGRILFESEEGKGTVFRVYFPQHKEA
jgi:signal transduction histidine kinase